MKIIEDKQNLLLKRREVKVIVEADKNPTMQEAGKLILEHFKTIEENIAIKQIKGKFGRKTFLIAANVYNSKEDKEKIEPKPKTKKGQAEEKKEEGEKAEGKEEKPIEKKQEEKKE